MTLALLLVATFLGALGGKVLDITVAIFAPTIASLLVAALVQFLHKHKIEVSLADQARLREVATDAIHTIEEVSKRTEMTSEEKAAAATGLVTMELPKKTADEAGCAVDAALAKARGKTIHPVPSTPGTFGQPAPA